MKTVVENYHADVVRSYRMYKTMAEKSFDQVSDDEFFTAIDAEANSIAVIAKHIAGNLVSRWTDFLTTDGEKPERNRDAEFEMIDDTRASLMEFWERGWRTLFAAIEPLSAEDFSKTVSIRGEPYSIAEALNRQMTHYAYHVGQIVLLAKHFRSDQWQTLSVPRNRSAEYTKLLRKRQEQGAAKADRLDAFELLDLQDKNESGPE